MAVNGAGMLRRHWPSIGAVAALGTLTIAMRRYPGGTTTSAATVGYRLFENFISTLFAKTALNGAPNPARR